MNAREATLQAFINKGKRRMRLDYAARPLPPDPSQHEHQRTLRELLVLADACPFCGRPPRVGPANPKEEGSAWGFVRCETASCPAKPCVKDDSTQADERGSAAYIALAIRRWNRRP